MLDVFLYNFSIDYDSSQTRHVWNRKTIARVEGKIEKFGSYVREVGNRLVVERHEKTIGGESFNPITAWLHDVVISWGGLEKETHFKLIVDRYGLHGDTRLLSEKFQNFSRNVIRPAKYAKC
jgi:hypothetical protein